MEDCLHHHCRIRTLVDKLKLRDYVKSDIGKFVFEHRQKHGKQMLDGSRRVSVR